MVPAWVSEKLGDAYTNIKGPLGSWNFISYTYTAVRPGLYEGYCSKVVSSK